MSARLVLSVLLLASPLAAAVRPVSDAEHAAVRIAANYLSRGPAAVAEQLAATSPLRKLPAGDLLAEIEVRLGPREEARWELQTVVPALEDRMAAFAVSYPSGFDDAAIFELVKEGETYKIYDIRFLAQPSRKEPIFRRQSIAQTSEVESRKWLAIVFVLMAIALSAGAAFADRQRSVMLAMTAAASALVIVATAAGILEEARVRAANANAMSVRRRDGTPPRLAPLLPLRRIVAGGSGDVEAAHRDVDRREGRGTIADLWKIQSDLQQTNVGRARRALASFSSPSNIPLAEILRGRVALMRNDEAAAVIAFEHAVNLGPGRDGIWYETAQALLALGYHDRASAYLTRLARIGTREADVYYSLAAMAAANGRDDDAELLLQQAWIMRPVAREEILTADVFWSVLRRESVAGMIRLSAAADPIVLSPIACTRPIPLPVEAVPRTAGEFLHIEIGDQELHVPGGAALAIHGTPVVAATEWARADEERHLADLPNLMNVGRNAAAYAQPAMRQRISSTASALAGRNRWADLVELTENVSPSAEHVPPSIFFLRSVGLQRVQRTSDAKRLLAEVAASRVLQRRRDAAGLTQLAELFAAHDLFDAAVSMYDRSQTIRASPLIDDRVRQIQMNKRLATKYWTHETEHFEIRYPEDVSAASVADLGNVLESEFTRLQEWIPTPSFKRVVVNVVWWREFRSTYTGSDYVLGFYNGKITVPLAGVSRLTPPVVAVLGHELAHAMIAQATNDQAPRWFQEGLAQRIEPRSYHENAFNMYDDERLLPLSLLDVVLRTSPDHEMVSAAYIVSQTDIRYIESKYGRAALRKMLVAFREGDTTDEAIRRISGKSLALFETEMRQWGRSEARVFDQESAE